MENVLNVKNTRRYCLDLLTPAELAIYDSMQEVESMGADVKLTEVIVLLEKAKSLLADFVDEQISINI